MLILRSRLRQGLLPCTLLAGLVLGLTGCGGGGGGGGGSSSSSSSDNGGGSSSGGTLPITLHGTVNSGSNAVSGATVLVYAASLTPGTAPRQIGHAATAGDGSWSIGSFVPVANQLIYAVALGGNAGAGNNPQTSLMTAVITSAGASLPASLTLNELSTMAAASQLQNYITLVDCSTITGTSITAAGSTCPSIAGASGLATQAATIANLVNPATGQDSAYLTSNAATNSTLNATMGKLNFLGNALFSCISSTGGTAGDGSACGNLLQTAWTSGSGTLTPVTGSPFATANNPQSVAVSPDGKFVYTTSQSSNTVSAYAISSLTGALTAVAGSPFATGFFPVTVTVTPNGAFAYVTNWGSQTVSAYTINSSTGALTAVGSYATGTTPLAITVSPNNAFVYVTNQSSDNVSAYTINSSTGALTAVTGSPYAAGTNPLAVTVSPNGQFAYVASQIGGVYAWSINASTGALTAVSGSPYTAGSIARSVTVSPNGNYAYVANDSSSDVSVFSINAGTGALTAVTGSPFASGSQPLSVTLSPNGAFAYTANFGDNTVSAWSVNSSTGALTALAGSPYAAGNRPYAVTVAANGQFAFVADDNGNTSKISAFLTSNGTTDTLRAALALARQSANSGVISSVYALSPLSAYAPVPVAAPANWTLSGV